MKSPYERQLELENESVELGVMRYRKAIQERSLSELPPGLTLLHRSIDPMVKALEEFLTPSSRGGRLHTSAKFLRQFDPLEVAFITARRLINAIEEEESIQSVAISLGNALVDHLEYKRFKEEVPNYVSVIEHNLNKRTQHERHRRTVILRAKRKLGIEDLEISQIERLHVGIKLIDLFIQSTGLIKKERDSSEKGAYRIRGTDQVLEWIARQHARCELLSPVYLPMVVPPVPWESPYGGGFLTNSEVPRLTLIKTRNREYLDFMENHDMPLVYRAVNALQNVPWRINKRILEVIKAIEKADSGLGGLPTEQEEPLPPAPWSDDKEFEYLKKHYPEVVKSWKRKATEVWSLRIANKSKRIQLARKLWIADKFKDEERIYFVWSLDWRGRMYPVQTFVNPQADDVGRALLEFAEGKPLGHDGLRWLMIHLANKYGIDKVPFDERIEWVRQNHDEILRWAEDPLTYTGWAEADSPFQCLAAAFEYAEVFTSGELYAYESHLPIQMDGSCNGLQNFSAMLRDEVGGTYVNLVPQERPADVYAKVAEVVSRKIEKEAAEGNELAKLWVGKVDRSIAKRNVMTLPYGVTLYGMREQLELELSKRNVPGEHYLDTDDDFEAAVYLAKKMWESIGEVVVAARKAMDWLQEVAKVCSEAGVAIRWSTPSGFVVEQSYRKSKNKRIDTIWGTSKIKLSLNFPTNKLDRRKQTQGIAPNFVHSMDASHLVLTINRALDEGITAFSMIHDSYGTHAADAEKLAWILREAFVDMYREDVLEKFRQEVLSQLPEEFRPEVPPVPERGNLDIEAVKDSLYFFA